MTINLVIAVAKTMPVVFKQRWRHRRIAKARMTARIGRNSPGDVTASCVKSIMVALLGGLQGFSECLHGVFGQFAALAVKIDR